MEITPRCIVPFVSFLSIKCLLLQLDYTLDLIFICFLNNVFLFYTLGFKKWYNTLSLRFLFHITKP